MGVSPATGPTPNKGYEAAAMQRVGVMLKMAMDTLPMAGATSDLGKLLLKFMTDAGKLVPTGSNTGASERNQLDKMQVQNAQNQQTMQGMKPGGGGQGGPPGMAGGGQGAPAPGGQGMAA